MAIHLTTGLPGSFKSTSLIENVQELARLERRDVYYHNIDDLKLPWHQLEDPKKWMDVPPRGIVVIDECQDVFPTTGFSKQKPDHYMMLARHRKLGLDIYLVTQHPDLIDNFVRKLVNHHDHYVRVAGSDTAAKYSFIKGIGNVEKGLKSGSRSLYRPDTKTHDLHRSAEAHTVRTKFPKKILLVIPLLGALVYFGYSSFMTIMNKSDDVLENQKVEDYDSTVKKLVSSTDEPARVKKVIERKVNTFEHGALSEQVVNYLGYLNNRHIFEVAGVTLYDNDLETLGYPVAVIGDCVVVSGKTTILCKPNSNFDSSIFDSLSIGGELDIAAEPVGSGGGKSSPLLFSNQKSQPTSEGSVNSFFSGVPSTVLVGAALSEEFN